MAVTLCIAMPGCAPLPKVDDLGQSIANATATADPIRFETIGGPLDVATTLPAGPLTVADAARLALQSDPQLQAALARVHAALAESKQARLLPNPILSVAVRVPESGGSPAIEAGLTADLLSLITRPRQASAADSRLRAACAEAVARAIDTVADVQERYLAVQALDAQRTVLNERQTLTARLLEMAAARVTAGEANQLDVLTLQAEQADLDTEGIQTDSENRTERLTLARLLGRPSADAAWPLSPWETPAAPPGDESQWIATALAHRPEIQAQAWELAALGDEAAIAAWASFDGLAAGADAERDGGPGGEWSVGPAVDLPLPLFDWGQARNEKAKALVVEARHRMTQLRRQTVEDVRRAWATLAFAQQALGIAQDRLIPLQERRQAQAEAAYRNGFADITAVWVAQQEVQAARFKLIGLQRDASLARVRLQRAVGGAGVARHFNQSPAPEGASK